jgi:hypothetical protein
MVTTRPTFLRQTPSENSFTFATSIPDDELEALVALSQHVTNQRDAMQVRQQNIEDALKLSQVLQQA